MQGNVRVSKDQAKDGLALRKAYLLRRQQIRQMRKAKLLQLQGLLVAGGKDVVPALRVLRSLLQSAFKC